LVSPTLDSIAVAKLETVIEVLLGAESSRKSEKRLCEALHAFHGVSENDPIATDPSVTIKQYVKGIVGPRSRFLHGTWSTLGENAEATRADAESAEIRCRIIPMKYGYARVSSDGQSIDAQVRQLKAAGARQVFREVASGAKTDRAQLRRVLARLDAGDVLMVTRLDRLARSTRDLLNTLAAIASEGAGFRSLGDTWADTTTPHGRSMPPCSAASPSSSASHPRAHRRRRALQRADGLTLTTIRPFDGSSSRRCGCCSTG
jgi:Resolvase, N terminal domain